LKATGSTFGEEAGIQIASALHKACVHLERARGPRPPHAPFCEPPAHWTDDVGRHVALAIAAIPDHILEAWLFNRRTIGGEEVYRTLKAGAQVRAAGTVN
jgi:hypothetical protein